MVSGTISLPSRGAFHLSLTVLVHYRSRSSIQAYPAVGADSDGVPRVPPYLGDRTDGRRTYEYRTFTFFGAVFNQLPLERLFVTVFKLASA